MDDQDEGVKALAKVEGAVVARRWVVSLAPDAAFAAIERGLVERSPEVESATSRLPQLGSAFVSRTAEGGLVLWRRPDRHWTDLVRGVSEPVPYPQMLHLEARETVDGTELVATWRPHPATRKSRTFVWASVALFLAMGVYFVAAGTGWFLLFYVAALVPAVARHLRLRGTQMSLLAAANAPLAQHELGAADVHGSAFRAGHVRDKT